MLTAIDNQPPLVTTAELLCPVCPVRPALHMSSRVYRISYISITLFKREDSKDSCSNLLPRS
jgi:C4-type Zn-finger protein